MATPPAHERILAWRRWLGYSQERLGNLIGCTQGAVGLIERDERGVGRKLANRIAARMAESGYGDVILPTDWDD